MSISYKSSNAQVFRLMIYRRALHPELFELASRKTCRHGDYEAELWLVPAGHVVRFQLGGRCLTEAVVENCNHLPETGLVHALPCVGEKDYELDAEAAKPSIGYVTTIQTENLTDNLYMTTLREMREFAQEPDTISHEWQDIDGTPCMTLLDMQKYRREFHLQSYHLGGSSGVVLRTQSIFEIA